MLRIAKRVHIDRIGLDKFCELFGTRRGIMQNDIIVSDHDNIVVLMPATKKGKAWLRQNVLAEERKHVGSVIIEQAATQKIINSALAGGLRVTVD